MFLLKIHQIIWDAALAEKRYWNGKQSSRTCFSILTGLYKPPLEMGFFCIKIGFFLNPTCQIFIYVHFNSLNMMLMFIYKENRYNWSCFYLIEKIIKFNLLFEFVQNKPPSEYVKQETQWPEYDAYFNMDMLLKQLS